MGIFDLFGSSESRERRPASRSSARRSREKYGPPENRQKAIEQLGEIGTPAALKTLCLRFTVRCRAGHHRRRGEGAGPRHPGRRRPEGPRARSRSSLREQESGVAWGLRVLASLAPPEEVLGMVLVAAAEARARVHPRPGEEAGAARLAPRAPGPREPRAGRRPRARRGPRPPARGLHRRRAHRRRPGPDRGAPHRRGPRGPHRAPASRPGQRPGPRRGAAGTPRPRRRREGAPRRRWRRSSSSPGTSTARDA